MDVRRDGRLALALDLGLEDGDRRTLLALAEVATPAGRFVGAADGELVDRVVALLPEVSADLAARYGSLLRALELSTLAFTARRFSSLPRAERAAALARLDGLLPMHALLRALTTPLKLAQVLRGELAPSLGIDLGEDPLSPLRIVRERERWQERLVDARELEDGTTFEVDAVVVGSGAGGAPVALNLASRGHAVLVLEAGAYVDRADFRGPAWRRGVALIDNNFSLGNTSILVPTGSTVGGTTTVNSGTCFRTPAEVLRRWRFEDGLRELDPASMEPFFERVEARLGVAKATPETLGGCGRVIARGAEALGFTHGPLPRNAPGCDGQGVCCFGCPTDAKRSTNVSYVPAALHAGATLVHHARVEEILMAGGRAVGVVARARGGDGRRLFVRAKSVVLATGTLGTPSLLLRQNLANASGQVGRNLTIHPAAYAWARFHERIDGWRGIPQGYSVEPPDAEGLRFEGVFLPLDLAASTSPLLGHDWTDFVEGFGQQACYGFMLAETSRGRVILGRGGKPQILYRLNDADRRRLLRGYSLLARIYLAAGARSVRPGIRGARPVESEAEAHALEHLRAPARALELSAYHPLGTCRMGADPSRSVVGPNHEAHDVPGLFVVDGSVVSGPLGVNPQITIMALGERASAFVEARIERTPASPRARLRAGVEFAETMSGAVTFVGEARERAASFTVRAHARDSGEFGRALLSPSGAVVSLAGAATVDGVARERPCEGTLRMRPRARRGTLIYDLDFVGDDGLAYHLHGEKNVRLRSLLSGMTTLDTELTRADEIPMARGTLTFAMKDLVPFLATWRIRP